MAALLLFWLVCGFVAAGFDYAYFMGRFGGNPRQRAGESLVLVLGGPIALVVTFLLSGFGMHGWWKWGR